jgi:hypothetical protein
MIPDNLNNKTGTVFIRIGIKIKYDNSGYPYSLFKDILILIKFPAAFHNSLLLLYLIPP